MRPLRLTILLLLCVPLLRGAAAQVPFGIAYCDVDRFCDTVASPFRNDLDYTPEGRLAWTAERYCRKVAQTAAVVDSLALPVVILFGVENEAVVRDVARCCARDYAYLHRTLNRRDGRDFALLYFGDRFFPHHVEPGGDYLYVEGTLADRADSPCDTLGLLLCSDGRTARMLPRLLRRERPGAKLLLLGRFDPAEALRAGLREATDRAERAGRGNRFRRNRWEMADRIAVDTALRVEACEPYIRPWLLDPQRGTPLPTYAGGSYRGGYSGALPIFLYIAPR